MNSSCGHVPVRAPEQHILRVCFFAHLFHIQTVPPLGFQLHRSQAVSLGAWAAHEHGELGLVLRARPPGGGTEKEVGWAPRGPAGVFQWPFQ